MTRLDRITLAVEQAIEDNALDLACAAPPRWRRTYLPMHEVGCPATTGFCAAGAEAVYYLAGGKDAGLKPFYAVYEDEDGERGTHWWIEDEEGIIYDPTASQFEDPEVLYVEGIPCGFQSPTKQPTPLASAIMALVTEKNPYREWQGEEAIKGHMWPFGFKMKKFGRDQAQGDDFAKKVGPREWRVYFVGSLMSQRTGTLYDEGTYVLARSADTGQVRTFDSANATIEAMSWLKRNSKAYKNWRKGLPW